MSLKKLLSIGMAAVISLGTNVAVNAYDPKAVKELSEMVVHEKIDQDRIVAIWNIRQMGAMVKGKILFDAEKFAKSAKMVALMAKHLQEDLIIFYANWGNRESSEFFLPNSTKFETESAKMVEVSKTAMTVKEVTPQFLNLIKACKSCHIDKRFKANKVNVEKEMHEVAGAIEYRQTVMEFLKWEAKSMEAMVTGKIPFDADTFSRRAKDLAFLSKTPVNSEGFIEDTNDESDTDAKPAIWKNWSDFNAKMAKLEEAAAQLAEISKTATAVEEVTPQFLNTTQACKSCHKKYRK